MSTAIYNTEDLSITQYYGGEDDGIYIQILTPSYEEQKYVRTNFITMNRKTTYKLYKELGKWLKETEPIGFIEDL